MAQAKIKVFMKNRKTVEIPQANIGNFKRIFFDQIDYIEETEGEPIIAKPVIEEIKKPLIEEIKKPTKATVEANDTMSKKELQVLAKDKEGYKASLTKDQLVALINK